MDIDNPRSPGGSSESELSYHGSRSVTPEILKAQIDFSDELVSSSPTDSADTPSTQDSGRIPFCILQFQLLIIF